MSALSKKLECYIEVYSALHFLGEQMADMTDVFQDAAQFYSSGFKKTRLILLGFLIKEIDEQFKAGKSNADLDVLKSQEINKFRAIIKEIEEEIVKEAGKN